MAQELTGVRVEIVGGDTDVMAGTETPGAEDEADEEEEEEEVDKDRAGREVEEGALEGPACCWAGAIAEEV